MEKLNKDSSVPLYQQLVDDIKDQVIRGVLKPNDRIMPEMELSKKYSVSRITVRKAIELLVEDGLLIKRQGIGTFVAEKKLTRNMNVLMGFTQNCEAAGCKAGTKFLSADLIEASAADIRQLKLDEEDKVIRIRRLRYCDDALVVLEENHFPQKFAFLLGEDLNKSLHKLLLDHGIQLCRGIKNIDICYATKEEANLLEVKENSALLLIKDITYDQNDEVVYSCKNITIPNRYSCTIVINN